MVTVTVSGIVMAGMLSAYTFLGRNLVRLSSLEEFDNRGRQVLVLFNRDVNAATQITSATEKGVSFTLPDGTGVKTVTYSWNDSVKTFSRIDGANTVILLRDVSALSFSYFDRGGSTSNNPIFIKQVELVLTGDIGTSGLTRKVASARQILASKPLLED